MTSVLVHYSFEEEDDTLNFAVPATSQVEPPALPFPLKNVRTQDAWFATLPEATRAVLEHVAKCDAEEWAGGERIRGAVLHPIN